MKAIVCTKYGPQEDLQLKDVEKPAPKDDEVPIKVHAASVNSRYWRHMRANPFFSLFQKPVDGAWPGRSPIESGFPCLYYLRGLSLGDDPMDRRAFSSGCIGTNPKLDLQTRIGLLSSPISHRVDFG